MFGYQQQAAVIWWFLSISIADAQFATAYNSGTDNSEKTHKSKTVAVALGSVFGAALFVVALIVCVVLIWKRMLRNRNFPLHRHHHTHPVLSSIFHPQITYRKFMVQRMEKRRRKRQFNEESHLFSGGGKHSTNATNKRQHHMGCVSDWTQHSAGDVGVDGSMEWGKQNRPRNRTLKPFGISIYDGTPKNQSSSPSDDGSVVGSDGETATRTPMTMNDTLIDEETAVGPGNTTSECCWYDDDDDDDGGCTFDEDGVYQSFGVNDSQDMMNTTFNTYLQEASRFGDTFTPSFRV